MANALSLEVVRSALQRLSDLKRAQLLIDPGLIQLETDLENIGLDSLAMSEFALVLEEICDADIEWDLTSEPTTVAEIIASAQLT